MLTFVGLGLYDERSVTVAGRDAVASADRAFAEFYTSRLSGATVADLEAYHDVDVEVRDRDGVERDAAPILDAAEDDDAVFLVAGDPMISTTHVDLRLRARERGIDTRVVHAPTAQSAASGLTGLQNYRFGKATTLPFPYAHGGETVSVSGANRGSPDDRGEFGGVPESVVDAVEDNRERGLHTLVYLDIKADRDEYMSADVAADLLAPAVGDLLGVAVARAGSPDPVVAADRLSALADREFGDPLHLLVIPGDLHHLEAEALREFGDAPPDLLPADRG